MAKRIELRSTSKNFVKLNSKKIRKFTGSTDNIQLYLREYPRGGLEILSVSEKVYFEHGFREQFNVAVHNPKTAFQSTYKSYGL